VMIPTPKGMGKGVYTLFARLHLFGSRGIFWIEDGTYVLLRDLDFGMQKFCLYEARRFDGADLASVCAT
jgi:hypothetical protein